MMPIRFNRAICTPPGGGFRLRWRIGIKSDHPSDGGPMFESGIFKAAVKLPADRRAPYLDQACGSDAELRGEIESLSHAHDTSGGFLEEVLVGPDATEDYQPVADTPARSSAPISSWSRSARGGSACFRAPGTPYLIRAFTELAVGTETGARPLSSWETKPARSSLTSRVGDLALRRFVRLSPNHLRHGGSN